MQTVKGIVPYFDKIAEELIDTKELVATHKPFLVKLGEAYNKYEELLYATNNVDFAYQEKILYTLLLNEESIQKIKQNIKYIMVDEYQDTNFIQEKILLRLASPDNNICVVGDEDQSLYRFRGATVRNILEFPSHFTSCKKIVLRVNYRSHRRIIKICNDLIRSVDWSNHFGQIHFRFNKTLTADPDGDFPEYPAVFSISASGLHNEAKIFAEVVKFLKDSNIIPDYSHVVLLLHSVRLEHSSHYTQALEEYNIPFHLTGSKSFFENKEVKLVIGYFAALFDLNRDTVIPTDNSSAFKLQSYLSESLSLINTYFRAVVDLMDFVSEKTCDINNLKMDETLDNHIIDYFYELLRFEPFSEFLKDQNMARNLAILSQLISTFQKYYDINVVTARNIKSVRRGLFEFLGFLLDQGIDSYRDPDKPILYGHVQIMTIHQSKGLQFPVVFVGSSNNIKHNAVNEIDGELEIFYNRSGFEPKNKITEFDAVREYYVAFSRAEKLLVLTGAGRPDHFVEHVWNVVDRWPHLERNSFYKLNIKGRKYFPPKRTYSLTSDINIFEVCPAQYRFYREYQFSPSRSAATTFGILVHQTIEDIHKQALQGRLVEVTNEIIAGVSIMY